ncbi:DUF7018 domain-containing (lipo)protein [Bacillus mycoides]|uniref:hypothetical protein n=1 Tax=Bacillus mycoides TaxID=1405 RepID=UPI000B4AFCAB|nr:hypothetical protein [Bacillus mycoides]
MKRKIISIAAPLALLLGGCSTNEKVEEVKASNSEVEKEEQGDSGESKYETSFRELVADMSKTMNKVDEIIKQDDTLYEVQEEFEKAVMDVRGVVKEFKELSPDSKYDLQQKKIVRAMDELELATTKLMLGMDNTQGYTFQDGLTQYKKAIDLYVKAGYQIIDIRDGKELGTTEKG